MNHISPTGNLPEIPGYTLEKLIGQGAGGFVYKAIDQKMKRSVALKFLKCNKKKSVTRFKREIETLAKLRHPNIVKLYNVHYDAKKFFVAMQYIEGFALDEHIKKNKLDYVAIAQIFIKILRGLSCIHDNQIVHRDLKPLNILVSKTGNPYIMDFGVAKIATEQFQLTKTGEIVGTLCFMSPEQITAQKNIDLRSDIYSLGGILYYIMTGQLPFSGNNPMQVVHQIATSSPASPCKINRKIPVSLAKICLKAIEKKKENRYVSSKEMIADLENFIQKRHFYIRTKIATKRFNKFVFSKKVLLLFCVITAILLYLPKTNQKLSPFLDFESEKYFEQQYEQAHGKSKINLGRNLVLLKVKLKKYKEALLLYNQLKSKKMIFSQTLLLAIAKTKYYLDDPKGTLAIYRRIKVYPKNRGEINYYKGMIAFDKGEYKQAKDYFEKSKMHTSGNIEKQSILHLGISYAKIKTEVGNARKYLLQAAEIFKQDVRIWYYLGYSYLPSEIDLSDETQTKNVQIAYEYFQKCQILEPNNSDHFVAIAKCLLHQKKYYLSYSYIEQALSLNPSNSDALDALIHLTYKEPFLQVKGFDLQRQSTGITLHTKEPDIFSSHFDKWEQLYQEDFFRRRIAKDKSKENANLSTFLEKLHSENKEVIEFAIRGIINLRYYNNIWQEIESYANVSPHFVKERLEKIKRELKKHIQYEAKFAAYYEVAHNYNKIRRFQRFSDVQMDTQNIEEVLKTSTDLSFKYAALKVYAYIGKWDFIHRILESDSLIDRIICCCVLREVKYPIPIPDILPVLQDISVENRVFLQCLVAKNAAIRSSVNPQAPEYKMNTLCMLLEESDFLVQLCAASSIFSMVDPSDSLFSSFYEKSSLLLLRGMHHKNEKIRAYCHYYFWNIKRTDIEQYQEKLLAALKDNSKIVNSSVLVSLHKYSEYYSIWESAADSLLRKNKNNNIALLCLFNLAISRPNSAKLKSIQNDDNFSSFLRAYTFIISKYFLTIYNLGVNNQLLIQNIQKLISRKNNLLKIKSKDFKAFLYYTTASWGYHSPELLQKEPYPIVKANMICNLSHPSHPIFRMFLPSVSDQEKLSLAKFYLNSKSPDIRRGAIASYIALVKDEEIKDKMYENLKNNQNIDYRQAGAEGFYRFVFKNAVPINMPKEFKTFFVEESYDQYLVNLREKVEDAFINDKKNFSYYKKSLQRAINLFPRSEFFFELALINSIEKNEYVSLENIRHAISLSPKNSLYNYTLAKKLYDIGEKKDIMNLLKIAEENTSYIFLLRKIASLCINMKEWDLGEKIFYRIFILSPYEVEQSFLLVRLQMLKGEEKRAVKHLKCLHEIENRKKRNHDQYQYKIVQSLIQKDPLLKTLYDKYPWIKKIPK